MKTAEEKIQFKNHFFKLGQGRVIPQSDLQYWQVFWTAPKESSEIYDLLTSADVQTVRDQNLPNFLLLVRVLCVKVVELSKSLTPRRHYELRNCLRLLTKLLPYVFELPNFALEIESRLFWDTHFNPLDLLSVNFAPTVKAESDLPNSAPLAVGVITSLVRLLFTQSFTIGSNCPGAPASLTLWEPGIGAVGKYEQPNPVDDCNRTEVLRLLLTFISTSFYLPPSRVISQGSKFLTILVAALPKKELFNLLCSLINIFCRSARSSISESGLAYESLVLAELRHICVTYSVQLLAAMLVYPLPAQEHTQFLSKYKVTTQKPYNMVRLLFGKLSKDGEIKFLVAHLFNILKFPVNLNYETDPNKRAKTGKHGQPSLWALEGTVILWELLQCNKAFRESVGERLVPKLVPNLLYHIFAFHDNNHYANLVKITSYFLLYISAHEVWVTALVLHATEGSIENFPPEFRMNGTGSTRDFLIVQICQILHTLISSGTRLSAEAARLQSFLLPTLMEVLYNIIPAVDDSIQGTNDSSKGMANTNPSGGLSHLACNAITQLLIRFSSRQFLLEGPNNAPMLALILRALCSAATKSPQGSRMLLYSFLKHEKSYDQIWNVIYSLNSEYFSFETLKLMNVNEEDEEEAQELGANTPEPEMGNLSRYNLLENTPQLNQSDLFPLASVNDNEDPATTGFGDSMNHSVGSLTHDEAKDEIEEEQKALEAALRPCPPTGMSQKAREKLPRDSPLNRSWGGNDALKVIITVLIPCLKASLKEIWSKREECNFDNFFIVTQIEHSHFEKVILENKAQLNYDFLPDTPVEKLLFSWSHISLGWYASTLYWNVFNAPENVKLFVGTNKTLMKNISSSIAVLSKFASSWSGLTSATSNGAETQEVIDFVEKCLNSTNVWVPTNVKLFKVKGGDNDKFFNPFNLKFGNSVLNAGGDIANSLARRFSDFRMNSRSSISSVNLFGDDIDPPRLSKRNSVSSLHSLNTLNRSRSNTPRNSISI